MKPASRPHPLPQPMTWAPGLDVLPVRHGSAVFAMAVRECLWHGRYAAVAIAFPEGYDEALGEGIEHLPEVHGLVFRQGEALPCYLPFDPCDAYVEGWRQAAQRQIPCIALEDEYRLTVPRLVSLPDAQLLPALGVKAYHDLALRELGEIAGYAGWEKTARQAAATLRLCHAHYHKVLLLADYPILPWLDLAFHGLPTRKAEAEGLRAEEMPEKTWGGLGASRHPIKPEQLYFALGEAPFFAAEVEKERMNPLASPRAYLDLVKSLFLRTREQFLDNAVDRQAVTLKAVQQCLQFTRNLAALERSLTPSLFDLLTAAKGVLGSAYARKLLEAARYYPFFDLQRDDWLEVGPDGIALPDGSASRAFNVLADQPKAWRPFKLKPEPDKQKQRDYRYAWDSRGLCSYLPEDVRIERFNRTARTRSREREAMALSRVEKLTTSLRDGIDLRETLRHWHQGGIYVREIPPQTRKVDTVVVLFDTDHDEKYPQRVTWYAEHPDESTLTFFATEPLDKLIGPGIAEAEYGGFSLLFPPRHIPDIFALPASELGLRNLAEQLLYGALLHSREKAVTLVSEMRPTLRMRQMARRFGRRIIHLPLTHFSTQTLKRLRKVHLLNGKHVRAWAARFIEE